MSDRPFYLWSLADVAHWFTHLPVLGAAVLVVIVIAAVLAAAARIGGIGS